MTLKRNLVCRDYRTGDEIRILELFKEVFSRELSLAFWKWRFAENPFGKGIIKLMFDRDRLVGHYAVTPMDVSIRGELTRAAFSMTTMTHPEYSGQGIFTSLAEETYKSSREQGYSFVYGFPNNNSQPAFVNKLKWLDLGKMTALKKTLRSAKQTSSLVKSVKEVKRFGAPVDKLWDTAKDKYSVIVPRTQQYLNWRFTRHPHVDYIKYLISDNISEPGYIVLKVFSEPGIARGHIVDIMSLPDKGIAASLLEKAYEYFRQKGIDNVSAWMPEGSFHGQMMQDMGFIREATETNFGVRSFSKDGVINENIGRFSGWHLTMSDSDVY